MDLDKTIEERHSARQFTSIKKVDWKKVIDAIHAANQAPLAGNIPSLRFILVDDQEKIIKLSDAAQQPFFENVQLLVAVCSDPTLPVKSYGPRGEIYIRQQAGAAIENFLLKITDLGLNTCWVGAFEDDMVKRILEVPENVYVEAMFPIGYELAKMKKRKKTELDNVLFFNKWKNKYMRVPGKVDAK